MLFLQSIAAQGYWSCVLADKGENVQNGVDSVSNWETRLEMRPGVLSFISVCAFKMVVLSSVLKVWKLFGKILFVKCC